MKKKAALCLSGGGALGAAHIGVIKVLEEQGYQFDYVAGVSAGSIVGSLVATGHSAAQMEKTLQDVKWQRMTKDFTRNKYAMFGGNVLLDFLQRSLGETHIEELTIPLRIGTTDFTNGDRVTLDNGSIVDAVRASCSIPGVFEPYFHEETERWLVDGFLSQNLPLDIACEEYEGDTIFSVDVGCSFTQDIDFSQKSLFPRAKHIIEMIERTFRILLYNQRRCLPQDDRVIHINPHLEEFSTLSYLKMKQIIAAGETAAKTELKK